MNRASASEIGMNTLFGDENFTLTFSRCNFRSLHNPINHAGIASHVLHLNIVKNDTGKKLNQNNLFQQKSHTDKPTKCQSYQFVKHFNISLCLGSNVH